VSKGENGVRAIARIGLVGCGRMGSSIGRHLLARDWPLIVYDVDPAAVRDLAASGAAAAPDTGGVSAEADLTMVIVVDDTQVREVLTSEGGVLDRAAGGSVLAICASVRPDTCRSLESLGAERGVHVIDVALVRGERGAEAGELLLLCGGPDKVIDACRSAFSAFASDVRRVGDVGAGQVAKAVNNVMLWACLRADVEALRLGRALGVDPGILRDVAALGSGANRPLAEWGQHRLRWPAKDLEVAIALAEDAGVDVPFVRSLAPLMAELTVEDLLDLR